MTLDVSPTTVITVGTLVHIRGAGCLDPRTHSGAGLQAAYRMSPLDTPATWPLQFPADGTAAVSTSGTFEWTRTFSQPLPYEPQSIQAACGIGTRQIAVYPLVRLFFESPQWTFPATATIGMPARFPAPCSVSPAGDLVLSFVAAGTGGQVAGAVVDGPLTQGATTTVTIPDMDTSRSPLRPGQYLVDARCDKAAMGTGGAKFGQVHVTLLGP